MEMMKEPCAVPCIICKQDLVAFEDFEETGVNHPLGGLEFTTPGHYGSSVFDSMEGKKLAINICDPCVTAAVAARQVLLYEPAPRVRQPKSKATVIDKL